MIVIRQPGLGVMFDYRTEAIRQAHNSSWTYVLVTIGPGGSNIDVLPLGTRELLDDQYEEAVTDPVSQGYAYVARFDKTITDLEPIDEALFVATQVHEQTFTKTKTVTKQKYVPYIVGGVLAIIATAVAFKYVKKRALVGG